MKREAAIDAYGVFYKFPDVGVHKYSLASAQECLGDANAYQKTNPNSLVFSSMEDVEEHLCHLRNAHALRELSKATVDTSRKGLNVAFSFMRKFHNTDEAQWSRFERAQRLLARADKALARDNAVDSSEKHALLAKEKRYLQWVYDRPDMTEAISEMCAYYKIPFSENLVQESGIELRVDRLPKEINIAEKKDLTSIFVVSSSQSILDGELPKIHNVHLEFDSVGAKDDRIVQSSGRKNWTVYYRCVIPEQGRDLHKKTSIRVTDYGEDQALCTNGTPWIAFESMGSMKDHFETLRGRVNGVCDDALSRISEIESAEAASQAPIAKVVSIGEQKPT